MLNLAKVSRKIFERTFYERVHIERGIASNLLSVDDFQSTIQNSLLDTKTLLLFNKGICQNQKISTTATKAKLAGRSSERYWVMDKLIPIATEKRYSIKVYNFSNYFDPLKKMDRELRNYFHTDISSNAYYTPSNSHCFESHKDPYNIIIIQTSGKKHWKVWEDKETIKEFTLEAGDVLILPKDMEHLAYTSDSHSLHMTYGVLEISVKEILINKFKSETKDITIKPSLSLEEKKKEFSKAKKELLKAITDFNPFEKATGAKTHDSTVAPVPNVSLEGARPNKNFSPSKNYVAVSSEYELELNNDKLYLSNNGYKFELENSDGMEDFIYEIYSAPFRLNELNKKCKLDRELAKELVNHLWECGLFVQT
ncbi:MAG: hypothetical protein CMJ16_09665 [Peredibacter sp.]|nr:hypothetical protein [Peredibacter sp.]